MPHDLGDGANEYCSGSLVSEILFVLIHARKCGTPFVKLSPMFNENEVILFKAKEKSSVQPGKDFGQRRLEVVDW